MEESLSRKTVEVPLTIRFGDTDPYGVVYCASYFRYCHHGIEEFFRYLGRSPESFFRNQEEGFGLPIVGASCDFLKPVRYGETLLLKVFITQARAKALTFGFLFMKDEGRELVARGKATMVAIDRNWQSRVLPQSVTDALAAYLPPTHDS